MPPDKKRQHNMIIDAHTTKKPKIGSTENVDHFLSNVRAFILKACIEKARLQIFKTQLTRFGGKDDDVLSDKTTHVIVDDKVDLLKMCRILQLEKPPDINIVKSSWLSNCFREKRLVDTKDYELDSSNFIKKIDESVKNINKSTNQKNQIPCNESETTKNDRQFPTVSALLSAFQKKEHRSDGADYDSDSDYVPSDNDEELEDLTSSSTSTTPSTSPMKAFPKGNWICSQSSKNEKPNFNKHITDKLEEMAQTYSSTNDKWRAFGYQKAIQQLKKLPKQITSWEEAMSLPGIGKRLADKIWEIAESGDLRKLNEFKSSEEVQVISLFTNVWGAGPHTARVWYQQGFRTLEDLHSKAKLTHQQKVGLRHYDDFMDRMPREEAAEIEKTVCDAAESIQPGIIAHACGSYRRGKTTCGDVDVLVTHPDGKSHKGIFSKLLTRLKEQGFLTDDLVSAEENGNQKKYLGVCKLPGDGQRYRRLDIIVVPYDEYACALVYFTGSAHFNRSLRHLAKKMGMSLSEHSLNTGVVRKGPEKIYEGTPLLTPTEESVFKHLGVPYRPPEERDH
ncbi:hypothetical protein CHS0354_014626 [Potamilus streckersoni]|uniref:DNA polymerase lambda n=1 Tax=Potamilus streckersoni TaxID=2493646 RepID=A0AAE0SQH7_9BIVA|nr:hypothetical protein CHS0354_014626 [Potamilus streckersoni]